MAAVKKGLEEGRGNQDEIAFAAFIQHQAFKVRWRGTKQRREKEN